MRLLMLLNRVTGESILVSAHGRHYLLHRKSVAL